MTSVDAPPSRRERKKHATRDAIHEAALALTDELGLAAVTVEAITEQADVAPRTFFNHFPSKVHAVLGRDPERADRLREALEARPAAEAPLTALHRVLIEDFLPDDRTVEQTLRRFRVVRAEPTLLAAMHAAFEETERGLVEAVAARTGQSVDDLYPNLIVSVAVSATRVAIMRWCETGGREPLAPFIDATFDHLADGLVPSPTERSLP